MRSLVNLETTGTVVPTACPIGATTVAHTSRTPGIEPRIVGTTACRPGVVPMVGMISVGLIKGRRTTLAAVFTVHPTVLNRDSPIIKKGFFIGTIFTGYTCCVGARTGGIPFVGLVYV